MSTAYVIVSDGPSEERCRVVTALAVYTSHSAAKAERARLNRLRAEEVARRAARLIGRHYWKISPSGARMTDAIHDEKSATLYAGYEVPVIGIVTVVCDAEVANGADVFKTERY
jgi:hypothetical protein